MPDAEDFALPLDVLRDPKKLAVMKFLWTQPWLFIPDHPPQEPKKTSRGYLSRQRIQFHESDNLHALLPGRFYRLKDVIMNERGPDNGPPAVFDAMGFYMSDR